MDTFKKISERIIQRLKDKGFIFLAGDGDPATLAPSLERFDKNAQRLGGYLATVLLSFTGAPTVLASTYKYLAQLEVERTAKPEQLEALVRTMKGFQLNAVKFSLLFGPKYLACVDCDRLTGDEIVAKTRQFEEAAAGITLLAGKSQMRAFGIPLSKKHDQNMYGSLCLCFSDPAGYDAVRDLVQGIKLRSDNVLAWSVKTTFKSLIPIWYLASKTENAVVLDRLVYRSFDNAIDSVATVRMESMYGFSLDDIKN